MIACPEPVTVECGSLTTVTTKVSDPEGDALVVVWSVNGTAIQTNELAAGSTTTPAEVTFPAEFPLGTNHVSVAATDRRRQTRNLFDHRDGGGHDPAGDYQSNRNAQLHLAAES